MSDRVDLHTHSTASDGKLRPSEVVLLAAQAGVKTLALTDHDTTDGIAEAQRAGRELGIEVIAGVEINSEGEHGDAHILGLLIDPAEPTLQEQLLAIRDARVGRAKGHAQKTGGNGNVSGMGACPGHCRRRSRPSPGHTSPARWSRPGTSPRSQEAFDKYISNDGPAYVNRLRLTMSEAIGVIHIAGGLAVLAHPAHSRLVHLIPQLVEAGLDGVEVYYPAAHARAAIGTARDSPRATTSSSQVAATFTRSTIRRTGHWAAWTCRHKW